MPECRLVGDCCAVPPQQTLRHVDPHEVFPDQQGANFDTDTTQSLVDAVQKALDDKAAAGEGSK